MALPGINREIQISKNHPVFRGATILANLEGAPPILRDEKYLGVGPCSAESHKNTTSNLIGSVVEFHVGRDDDSVWQAARDLL